MKLTECLVVAAGGLFMLVGGVGPVLAQTAASNPVEYLAAGKALFEGACGVCHGLERSLSKTFDKAGWEKTVERMHDNGAEVSGAERARVVAYLLAKNTFEAKCSVCHGTDRALDRKKTAAEWLATVQRMSGLQPGHLTDAESADIAAYLSVTRPLP